MGGGCFRAADIQALEPGEAHCECAEPIELSSRAKVYFDEVVARAGNANLSESEALRLSQALRGVPTQEVSDALYKWSRQGGKRQRSNLIQVLQKLIARLLDKKLVKAKEKLGSDSADLSFSSLSLKLLEILQLDEDHRDSVGLACQVLQLVAAGIASQPTSATASSSSSRARSDLLLSCVVPSLDSLVLIFRQALLSQINSSSGNLQGWRDFEEELGLPHLESLPLLLGIRAKALLVGLALVKDGVPPTTLVVSRTSPFEDARWQLSGSELSILSCYFESEVGTKVMQGKRVEGGEGHGPRKEFFINSCNDVQSKWTLHQVEQGPCNLTLRGHRLEAPPSGLPHALANASAGDRIVLRFEEAEAQDVSRVLTGKLGDATLLVDKPFEEDVRRGAAIRIELHRACAPLFQFHRGTNQTWFGPYSTQMEHPKHPDLRDRYRRFGGILALALANHCKLGFVLPELFFQFLLRKRETCALEDLRGFDDLLYTSLRKCLRMKQSQFEALREVEGLPPGATRELYVQQQVEATLCPAAMTEIILGFENCVGTAISSSVTPAELRQILCPVAPTKDTINIREVFDVILEEEMAECPIFVEAFWLVVDKLSLEDKKRFLMFVTGLDTPPEPGTEQLRVQLPFSAFSQDEHIAMLDMLPQAHTCTNTLELPNYYEALKESGKVAEDAPRAKWLAALQPLLKEKLSLAISETGGYELDGGGLLDQSQSLGLGLAGLAGEHAVAGTLGPRSAAAGGTGGRAAEAPAEEADIRKPWVQQTCHLPNCPDDRQGAALPPQQQQQPPTPVLLDRIHLQNSGSGESARSDRDLVIQDSPKVEKHGVNELLDDLDTLLTTLG